MAARPLASRSDIDFDPPTYLLSSRRILTTVVDSISSTIPYLPDFTCAPLADLGSQPSMRDLPSMPPDLPETSPLICPPDLPKTFFGFGSPLARIRDRLSSEPTP